MDSVLRKLTTEFFGQGLHKTTPSAFFKKENALILDVRTKEESQSITISLNYHTNIDCLNIPLNEVPDRISEIPSNKSIAIFCPANVRASIAYGFLLQKGFSDIRVLEGGYQALLDETKLGKLLNLKK